MSIDITKASDGTFYPFEEVLVLDNKLLSQLNASFESDIKVKGNYVLNKGNIYFKGKVDFCILGKCDRCLKPVRLPMQIGFETTYSQEGGNGEYFYQNFLVDISEGVSQEILLELPYLLLCEDNCKGICPYCGINLNEGSCDCTAYDVTVLEAENNPFLKLKDLNTFSGGASNGSTKG